MQFSLRELRARHSLGQEITARSIGVSTSTYNRWEKYPDLIPAGKFKMLADLFGVPMDDIFLPCDTNQSEA